MSTHALDPREEAAFGARLERHRGELQVHCYRMLGSFEDSEDLVQETFLRAWRSRASFGADGRSSLKAWLYRIATNACLDVLRRRPRRVTPPEVAAAADPDAPVPPPEDLPWLQPYPDRLLAPAEEGPEAVVVARETIELGFLAAIQHLPPRQRAVLILTQVLGWSAKDTGFAARGQRRRGQQRPAAVAGHAARAAPRATDGMGAVRRAERRRSASCCGATSTPTRAPTSTRWPRCCARTRD